MLLWERAVPELGTLTATSSLCGKPQPGLKELNAFHKHSSGEGYKSERPRVCACVHVCMCACVHVCILLGYFWS